MDTLQFMVLTPDSQRLQQPPGKLSLFQHVCFFTGTLYVDAYGIMHVLISCLESMSLLFSQVSCCIHIGYVSEHKNPIVSIHFLNEWGELQLVPYKAQTLDGKIRTCVTPRDTV